MTYGLEASQCLPYQTFLKERFKFLQVVNVQSTLLCEISFRDLFDPNEA